MRSLRSISAAFIVLVVASSSGSASAEEPPPTFGVSLHADAPVWLEAEDKATRGWNRACDAPCDGVALPTGLRYRVRGEGIRPTRPFEGTSGAVMRLDVRTSLKSTFAAGFVVLGVGSAAMIAGTVLYLFSLPRMFDPTDDGEAAQIAGAIVLGGIVAAAVGAGVIASSARSSLDDTPQPRGREARRERAPFSPPTVWSVPVFSVTF